MSKPNALAEASRIAAMRLVVPKAVARARNAAKSGTKCIIVGDIHGCYEELMTLVQRYGHDRQLVCVGDLVDKGPESPRVVEYVMRNGRSVLGNHEENHRRYAKHEAIRRATGKPNPMNRGDGFRVTHEKLSRSQPHVFEWFDNLPPYIEIPEHNTVVIHGGVLPNYTYKTMDPKTGCRVREVTPDGRMASLSEIKQGCQTHWPLTRTDTDGPFIVYGHDPFPEVREVNNTLCVDTGCVYGNRLSAYLLPERKVVSVKASKIYQARSSRHDWVNIANGV